MSFFKSIIKAFSLLPILFLILGCSDFSDYDEVYAYFEKIKNADASGEDYDCAELAAASFSYRIPGSMSDRTMGAIEFSFKSGYKFKNCKILNTLIKNKCDEVVSKHSFNIGVSVLTPIKDREAYFCGDRISVVSKTAKSEVVFPSEDSVFVEFKNDGTLLSLYDITGFGHYYDENATLWILNVYTVNRTKVLKFGVKKDFEAMKDKFVKATSPFIKAKEEYAER